MLDEAGGESHRAPGQAQDAAQLQVPGHQIEMTFAAHLAPHADDGDECDQKFDGVAQPQPQRIDPGDD